MFIYRNTRSPGQPCRVEDPRPVERVLDGSTGDAGKDGYTRLSRADRETGHRQPVGGSSEYPRYHED